MKIDRNWQAKFDWNAYDDYKEAWVEHDRLRQSNSLIGWIYIGIDTRRPGEVKVGKTTGELGTRASSTQNPYYTLFHAFKVKEGLAPHIIGSIEESTFAMLDGQYDRVTHWGSNKKSEWFKARPGRLLLSPEEMAEVVSEFLYQHYSSSMYCYYCPDRDIGVIHGWHNPLVRGNLPPYQALDHSNPPVAFECYLPGGCGLDCNCW
ncbi:hypothetical protein [Massilia sp. BSC265]|uniref:hypothetical protein n=1 Tax=Massilia sp. BSC265 TaxID=1549812 RepID=UPI00126A5B52|nr:hypothetical protein [Massilia sp. BSC265]